MRVCRFRAEPEVTVEEAQEEGDLPVGDKDHDEPLELGLVVPQQAREEGDGLSAEDLCGRCGGWDAAEAGGGDAEGVAALTAAGVEVAGRVGAAKDL